MLLEFKISQIIVETDLKVNTPLPLKYTKEMNCIVERLKPSLLWYW